MGKVVGKMAGKGAAKAAGKAVGKVIPKVAVKSAPKLVGQPRRMSPEDRIAAILQCAAKIVASEGVSAVTMERIAQDSGVSRGLIYVYFSNSTLVLQELFRRETEALRKKQREEAAKFDDLEDYARCLTSLYLENVQEKGDFMNKLMQEPSITEVMQSNFSRARRIAGKQIAERISNKYKIPVSVAARIADIAMGISARAGDQIQRFGLPLAQATDLTLAMIMGAVEGAAKAYRAGKIQLPDDDRLLDIE